ncbi:MAG: serine/threonine protein kinase [Kiritimatiellae bacterium]|nr:serine/threonine protein kinase [Kiritimatiellia bacterium]
MKFDDNNAILGEFLSGHGCLTPQRSFDVGTEVGEWRITGFLGRGGSSEVYCVRHAATGESAALKILHRTESRHIERFAREARLLGEMSSRHFPRLYCKGVFSGRPYIVIELLEPRPLPCKDRDVADFLRAVAEGVGYLHILGVVHRDIKPGNILWRKDVPVIIDLGLVREISSVPVTRGDQLSVVDGKAVGVGTPRYAAPEQFAGGEATSATDIHALGRLAYECFGGHPPRAWSRIIRRATSSIPGERYQTADDFIAAIRRRHLRRFAVSGFAAVLLVVLLGFFYFNGRGPQLVRPYEQSAVEFQNYRDFPAEVELCGYDLRADRTYKLKGGRIYRMSGPGVFDANIFADDDATLWITNCVVNNHTRTCWPKSRVKYVLAGDAYLNFADIDTCPPGVRLDEFIEVAEGLEVIRTNLHRNACNNDLRFGGPTTWERLVGEKNIEYFDEDFREKNKSHH